MITLENLEIENQALIVIDVQKGFLNESYWGKRNNPNLLENVMALISNYRKLKLPIIHVQHLSLEEKSPLRPGQIGVDFINGLGPEFGERVFQKSVNSAFIGTNLDAYLRSQKITSLILVGFTSDHCVSTTARMASNLGYHVIIISDCVATFDRKLFGKEYTAELVHEISLASLRGEFGEVVRLVEFEERIK